MLKITVDGKARRLTLEGSLAGPWVDTLEESWRQASAANAPQDIALDLSDVTYVDSRGRQLLRTIHQAGAVLTATGMNAAIVQETNCHHSADC